MAYVSNSAGGDLISLFLLAAFLLFLYMTLCDLFACRLELCLSIAALTSENRLCACSSPSLGGAKCFETAPGDGHNAAEEPGGGTPRLICGDILR